MQRPPSSEADEDRLGQIAAILQRAYPLDHQTNLKLADMLFALDNSDVRDIYNEICALQQEQLARLERLLSRHRANDE